MSRRARGCSATVGVRGCAILLACLGVALALGVVASSATLTTSFAAARNYAVGRGPVSVALADLNGDGKADLATANWRAKTVSILVNRGDGSFEPKRDLAIAGAGGFAVGDLNGDGRPDLATAGDSSNTVSVLMNTPGLCAVQNVKGKTLAAAKQTLARANCRSGKIRRAYSEFASRGRVISQKPRFGAVLPKGGKVSLVVSRGRK